MERETENPFAAVIRIMRGNMPQGVFAERLGIKQAKYSHYENHRREPSLDELCRIARALDTTPNVLLGFEPPPLRDSASPRETNIHDINGSFNIVGDGNTLVAPPRHHHQPKGKTRRNAGVLEVPAPEEAEEARSPAVEVDKQRKARRNEA